MRSIVFYCKHDFLSSDSELTGLFFVIFTSQSMRITRRYICSFCLLLLFLTPIAAKFGDGLFHHHDYFHCNAQCETHFHAHHEKCPILNYELSLLSDRLLVINYEKSELCVENHFTINYRVYSAEPLLLFYLRAPPQYISI